MLINHTIKIAKDISLRRVISSDRAGFALFTHRLGRAENQDGLLYTPRRFAVADGMGGSADGAKARTITLETLHQRWQAGDNLPAAFWAANEQVRAAAPANGYIGSTLVAAEQHGNEIEVVSCGDSRAYLVDRQLGLGLLTLEHSHLYNNYRQYCAPPPFPWFESGHYYEYLQTEMNNNWLTAHVGAAQLTLSYYRGPFQPGQRLLLCSDGLFNFIPYQLFHSIMLKFAGLKETVQELHDIAFSYMGQPAANSGYGDNFTALLIENLAA
jgi:PPM family protein phosphatase